MEHAYCLALENGVYKLGDLNLMLNNRDDVAYPPTDPLNPTRPYITGALRQEVTAENQTRSFLLYIPPRYPISGGGLFLYPDNGVSCEACLESWKALADETGTALIILEAQSDGWSKRDIQREVAYSEAVFKRAIARVYFSMNESTYYIMGLGAGAYVAAAYGLLNSSVFSCILADGDYHLDARLLGQLAEVPSDRDETCSKLDVVMPAWLVERKAASGGAVLEALQKANATQDRGLQNDYAAVYQQNPCVCQGDLDALPISQVCFTDAQKAAQFPAGELHRQMLLFALGFKRWLGIGNGSFRPARTEEDMGLRRFEAEIDGRLREWLFYEPTAYKKDPAQKRPLLLAIHGYSCTGKLFAENSQWHTVAQRRNFFVVYVSAFPSNLNFGGHTVPLPTWNAVGMQAEADDVGYIAEVLRRIRENYPVDSERIYVSGHSNGSLMTQRLMAEMPATFAAFAPQGAQFHMALTGNREEAARRNIPSDGIIRPVWLMMGSEDIGDQDKIEPGNANDLFLEMMCRLNRLNREEAQYLENGKYQTWTFPNAQGVPLLRFTGIQDTPHSFSPEMAQMYWDQFLCHFRRKADGSIAYVL